MKTTSFIINTLIAMSVLITPGFISAAQTPVETHGRLRVEGNRIVGEHGEPVQLMGMSHYWSVWGPQKYYNADVVRWLVEDWKVDLARASMAVEINQQGENKGWLYNRENQERMVETVIQAAIDNGIYVLVDWHTHHLHTEPAKEFFDYMAEKYGHYPNLIWETFNEPVRQSWPEIAEYTKEVTSVIRRHSDNLIIAGTRNWSQYVDEAADDPLTDKNTAYSLHFYAGTHGSELREKGDYALSKGIALFITEWGTSRADGGRDGTIFPDETEEWITWALERDISMANWSLADLRESSAALNSEASVSGGWHPESDLSPSGRLVRSHIIRINSKKPYYME
ncbi:MAG: glycoside hydrolase family 5 protein [Marinilabiliales bacterium]|nr:MAG: glycoside hydrolase family 5 protein [Marinilabiliales bacterium]